MLKRVYSRTLKSFNAVEFSEGFNFIVSKNSSGKSNNGTGKTSLLQIVNFCLCSSTENIVSYEDINSNEFSIDLEINKKVITLSRTPLDSGYIKIIDAYNCLGEGVLNDERISVEKAKVILNQYFFKEKSSDAKIPSFRLLISPFMKRGAYAFNNLFKTHAVENNLNTQLKNAFLLNINTANIYELKDIIHARDQYLKLKEVRESDVVWQKKTLNELKSEIQTYKDEIQKLKNDLKFIVVKVENQDIINQIDIVNENIKMLSKRKYYLKNIVKINRELIEKNKIMSNSEINEILSEATYLTNSESHKEITEIQEFHKKLISFREKRIKVIIQDSINECEKIDIQLESFYEKKEEYQTQLENNKYLNDFYRINKMILEKNIELEMTEKQYSTYIDIEKINKESSEEMKRTLIDMQETFPPLQFKEANSLFKRYTKEVFVDEGTLEISLKNTGDYSGRGYKFDWKISRKSSSGYLKGCIAIYDLILAETNSDLKTLFLIHDSPVFESTDKSYVASLLNLIYKSTQEKKFQYICCINDEQIIADELMPELKHLYEKTPNTLSQDNPLFGISFSK